MGVKVGGRVPEVSLDVASIMAALKRRGIDRHREQMGARFGIVGAVAETSFGVPVGEVRDIARTLRQLAKVLAKDQAKAAALPARPDRGRRVAKAAPSPAAKRSLAKDQLLHDLAINLWKTGQYEARLLAAFVDVPSLVTESQMDRWVKDCESWADCDTVCFSLFDRVEPALAFNKAEAWARSDDEFVRRAAFAILAGMALHVKDDDAAIDRGFARGLDLIESCASDGRNFVKKGVSWALRAIGKGRPKLRARARALATRLAASENRVERWIGKDALRDFAKL